MSNEPNETRLTLLQEIEAMMNRRDDLSGQLLDLTARFKQVDEARLALIEERNGLRYANQAMMQERDDSRAEVDSLRERLGNDKTALSAKITELEDLVEEGRVDTQLKFEALSKVEALEEQLEGLTTLHQKLADNYVAAEMQRDAVPNRIGSLEAHIESLERALTTANAEIHELRESRAALTAKLRHQGTELADALQALKGNSGLPTSMRIAALESRIERIEKVLGEAPLQKDYEAKFNKPLRDKP